MLLFSTVIANKTVQSFGTVATVIPTAATIGAPIRQTVMG